MPFPKAPTKWGAEEYGEIRRTPPPTRCDAGGMWA